MGLALLPASGKKDMLVAGRVLSPGIVMCLCCVWDRAVLPRKEARADTLEVRVVLKLLQWQHEFNQTPNLRSMDITF